MANDSITHAHGNAAAPRNTKRVFLISGTANRGMALNYNYDIIDATAEQSSGGSTISAGVTTWCDARRVQVETPTRLNNMHFAGVVDESSDGKTGPGWVTIHEPGSICEIYATGVCSAGVSAVQNLGDTLTYNVAFNSAGTYSTTTVLHPNGAFSFSGLPGAGTARVLSEVSAAGADSQAYAMAELLTGEQSGGVQVLATTATVSCFVATVTCIKHGRVVLSTATVSAHADSLISIGLPTFVGQELIIGPVAASATVPLILNWNLGISPVTSGAAAPAFVTCTGVVISGAAFECVHLKANTPTDGWRVLAGIAVTA